MKRIAECRDKEMECILQFSLGAAGILRCSFLRTCLGVRALDNATAFSLLILSSVVLIVTPRRDRSRARRGNPFLTACSLHPPPHPPSIAPHVRDYSIASHPPYQSDHQQLSLSTPPRTLGVLLNVSEKFSSRNCRTEIVGRLALSFPSRFA